MFPSISICCHILFWLKYMNTSGLIQIFSWKGKPYLFMYFKKLVTLTGLNKWGTYICVFSTCLCCVDSGCWKRWLLWSELGRHGEVAMWKEEFKSMYGYWFIHIFSWAMSSFGSKNTGVVLQEIKPCRTVEMYFFYYKSKVVVILLMSFCASFVIEHSEEFRSEVYYLSEIIKHYSTEI